MKLKPPVALTVGKSVDFTQKGSKLIKDLEAVVKSQGISKHDTVGDFLAAFWNKKIKELEFKHTYTIDSKIKDKLIARFVYDDKSYKVSDWSNDIPSLGFIEDLKTLSANSAKINKDAIWPIEKVILQLGVEVLQNTQSFLAASPDAALDSLRGEIDSQIKTIKSSKNVEDVDKMMGILKKIESIGGFEKLVPSEGLVFKWKGKTYKLTGIFAPLNQLMGIGRFGR